MIVSQLLFISDLPDDALVAAAIGEFDPVVHGEERQVKLWDAVEELLTEKAPVELWRASAAWHWAPAALRQDRREPTPYPEEDQRRWPVLTAWQWLVPHAGREA